MDQIRIENLVVFAHHGVFEEENVLGQKFVVSAVLYLDTRQAGMSDLLTESLDYGKVCHFICDRMTTCNYQLIEAVAEHLAQDLLLEYEMLQAVDLTVKKPWAPIMLPLDTVAVHIERQWHDVYLSIGSNLGDREGYLDMAIDRFNAAKDTKVTAISDYIETEPYGDVEQDDFLNGALKIRTLKQPHELLKMIHQIEAEAKRERIIHWGPRTLDIDILFYDQEIISDPDLIVPHIEIEKREFVLEPMMQIAPYFRHPVSRKTIRQLYEELEHEEK